MSERKRRVRDELRELRHDLLYGVRDRDRALGLLRQYNAENGSLLTHAELEQLLREPAKADGASQDRREPMHVDFNAPPRPPRWRVHGLIERGTVTVLSGDTGSSKSITAKALTVAAITGGSWLGHKVKPCRVIFVDEENPEDLVRARLRALGMTNAHRAKLRYFNRSGVMLEPHGGEDVEWLESEIRTHKAGLAFIDSASAATSAEVSDNTEAAAMMKQLRGIAARTHVAIVLIHHERKQQPGQTQDRSQATLGARQWVAQADTQITLAKGGPYIEHVRDDESISTERTFTLSTPKVRRGGEDASRKVTVTSLRSNAGALLSMEVRDRGTVRAHESEHVKLARETARVVAETPRAKLTIIGEAVGRKRGDGTLKRAITYAVDQEWIVAQGKTTSRVFVPGPSIEEADGGLL